ncbi:MAG TPA: hypothetical protein PKB13_10885 [Clostridia bacterium]|nr:hypothetical protein [Clostridia bacterium]
MTFEHGARRTSRRVDIIRNGVVVGQLFTRSAPTVAMDATATLKMRLSGTFAPSSLLDAGADLLRPVLTINGQDWPLGEYATSSAREVRTGVSTSLEIEAFDKSLLLQQAKLEQRLFLEAGSRYADVLQEMLISQGIGSAIIEPTEAVLATDREDWEIGTDYLTIINALLSEVNYDPLWFDLRGVARLQKTRQPTAENIDHTYKADEMSVIAPDCEKELDLYDAPNVWIVIVSNPDIAAPLMATAVNDNPASALSTVRRGRRIVGPIIKLDNIPSQAALQEYVDNVKAESLLSTETAHFSTAPMPVHGVGDVLALRHPALSGIYKETGWSITLEAGTQMQHTVKKAVFA